MKDNELEVQITSYVLGELSSDERQKFQQRVDGSLSLQLAVKEMEKSISEISTYFGDSEESLLPRQRESIRRAAKSAMKSNNVIELPSAKQHHSRRFQKILAVAAVATIGVFIMSLAIDPSHFGFKSVSQGNSFDFIGTVEPVPIAREDLAGLLERLIEKKELPKFSEFQPAKVIKELGFVYKDELLADEVKFTQSAWNEGWSFAVLRHPATGSGNEGIIRTQNGEGQLEIWAISENTKVNLEQVSFDYSADSETVLGILTDQPSTNLLIVDVAMNPKPFPVETESSIEAEQCSIVYAFDCWLKNPKTEKTGVESLKVAADKLAAMEDATLAQRQLAQLVNLSIELSQKED